MRFMHVLVFALLLTSFAATLGCNTFKGFGRDVQKGGEKIESVAEETKPSK